jgi:hypothetical protein
MRAFRLFRSVVGLCIATAALSASPATAQFFNVGNFPTAGEIQAMGRFGSFIKRLAPPETCITFDGFGAGAIVDTISTADGDVTVNAINPTFPSLNAAIIFDSANPTGEDPDLGTPNETFGGPGVGVGGEMGSAFENAVAKGNLLIIADDLVDANNDGFVDDPDDADEEGASVTLDFSAVGNGTVEVESMTFLDGETRRPPTQINLFAPGGALLASIPATQPGDNGIVTVAIDVQNVESIVVLINGSTSIDDVCYRLMEDCNDNGIQDSDDINNGTSADCNNNDIPDECEPDCDNDGTPDDCEPDCDNDGIPDDCEPDCDSDGTPDDCEPDCDNDGTPDECETDCDNDGTPDACEPDCNMNGTPDDCDISGGTSPDENMNGIPDECDPDCDNDGTPDDLEPDCDDDGTPDDCEGDCNSNGIPDDCEECGDSLEIVWDFEDCLAFSDSNSFAEFVGLVLGGCSNVSVDPSNLDQPNNGHSCTFDALNGDPGDAACVEADWDTFWDFDESDDLIVWTVEISESDSELARLKDFSFWHKAPQIFETSDANGHYAARQNNPPSLYGVRVLRDGVEIFFQDDIATSEDWVETVFQFDNTPDFQVSNGTAVFSFELMAYAPIDLGGDDDSIWDLDQFEATVCCTAGPPADCNMNGIADFCETDCNQNGIPDDCDILFGNSDDDDGNGIPDELCATNLSTTGSDPCISGSQNVRGWWFEGDFDPAESRYYAWETVGLFRENGDGTAELTGRIVNLSDPNRAWDVAVVLTGRVDPGDAGYPPVGSPKLQSSLIGEDCYADDGGPADPDTWRYYETLDGTLTGVGFMDGAELSITRRGEAFQIGDAANLKNGQFGGSGWYDYNIVSQPDNGPWLGGDHGDINTDLEECP